jgi:hypothetical protein
MGAALDDRPGAWLVPPVAAAAAPRPLWERLASLAQPAAPLPPAAAAPAGAPPPAPGARALRFDERDLARCAAAAAVEADRAARAAEQAAAVRRDTALLVEIRAGLDRLAAAEASRRAELAALLDQTVAAVAGLLGEPLLPRLLAAALARLGEELATAGRVVLQASPHDVARIEREVLPRLGAEDLLGRLELRPAAGREDATIELVWDSGWAEIAVPRFAEELRAAALAAWEGQRPLPPVADGAADDDQHGASG